MILVTGATGTIGSEIVRQLVDRGAPVRALTRNPEASFPPGVHVAQGDYSASAAVRAAMAGVEAAFLVGVLGPDDTNTDAELVAAARAAGVRRVVKLSAIGTGDANLAGVGTWHLPGEEAVRTSGLEWTILRPTAFASNTRSWAEPIRATGVVPVRTGDGRQGVVDPRDVAAVAVEALVSGEHTGRVYTPTGPELLSEPDQAAILGAALGRELRTTALSDEAARDMLRAAGLSDAFIDGAQQGAAHVRAGGNEVLTEDVRRVLGREPHTYARWVADHLREFDGGSIGART
ncbi:NAD(P)H-binding protein [Nocardia wallacei]|uniref:NAD(P)H-binding protein n=1 Tax=Nocardia wallacei TaxID=480035 RepID=UPI0024538C40|nr:NAD(P)H-binding protein [Nocardia wallacei]